jgi:hypothetical protein
MVIIVIRRFVRPDRIEAFIEAYQKQAPVENPAFKGETLARATNRDHLPENLRRLVADDTGGVTVINVARWESWAAFASHFADELAGEAVGAFNAEIETAPSQRLLLDVLESHSGSEQRGDRL